MTSTPFLVRVVSDTLSVRLSLSSVLRVAGYETRPYDGPLGLLADLAVLRHGCILIDLQMGGMDGLNLIEQLRSKGVRLPMIVMTGLGEVRNAVRVMRLGAVDFIDTPFTDATLLTAIAAAKAGPPMISDPAPAIAEARAAVDALSGRERQVLMALADGQPQKVIAHELGISARTVEVHRARMLHRLGTPHLAGAIRIAALAELGRIV